MEKFLSEMVFFMPKYAGEAASGSFSVSNKTLYYGHNNL